MATSIGKLSKSFFIKLLVGIIILPFVFWGMGSMFSSGNTNNLAKINNTKIFNLDDETLFMEFEDRVLNG